MMKPEQLRERYLEFFRQKNHAVIPSASLIPENDPTVLFTTAGMHPLVPYLMGAAHPAGRRLANVQKCIRTADIDDVGDASHLTFFEMLGNWSLGDYFKAESIAYSWEFLTDPDWLGLDPESLVVSVFEGDEHAPRDMESFDIWRGVGLPDERIFFLPRENNWWGPAGQSGPCGPDTEIFIDDGRPPCGPDCSPACSCGKYLEIWNNVFMQYNKTAGGNFEPLAQMNVDTGMGLDRVTAVLSGVSSVYDTYLFRPIVGRILELKTADAPDQTRAVRIIADHVRSAAFLLGDPRGVTPSNVDQGYVLRRLIRRALRYCFKLQMPERALSDIARVVIALYGQAYPELEQSKSFIADQLDQEEARFQRTLQQGIREFEKIQRRLGELPKGAERAIDSHTAFRLYDTFGFPIEMTVELAAEQGVRVDVEGFHERFREHQLKSQAGAEQRFKGGLADNTEATARLHTATHLLHAALRKVLQDDTISQKGSNITAERLRFDFSFPRKVTREELDRIEAFVNEAIQSDIPVQCEQMSVEQALSQGAIGLFESRYGDLVKVYSVPGYSCEICGGPHAERTGELGAFKIQKEEASSAGVRRIKAVLK